MEKVEYFNEYQYLYEFIQNNNIKVISITFTFAYGHKLVYEEVQGNDYSN